MNRLHLHMRYQNVLGSITGELYLMDEAIVWSHGGHGRNDARRHAYEQLERGENDMRNLTGI